DPAAVLEEQAPDEGRDRDDEGGQEQAVAAPFRRRGAFRLAGRRRIAAAEQAEAGEPDQAEHKDAVAEVPDPVPGEEAQRDQRPESGVAEPLAVGPVERAQHRKGCEHRPGEQIELRKADHKSSPSPDGEGDPAKRGGGVTGEAATLTPPPPFGWSPSPAVPRGESNLRSRSSRRAPWIRKAAMALGIAQTASWSGARRMPFCS